MIMMDKKKNLAGVILESLGPKKEPEEKKEEKDETESGELICAAEEIIEALNERKASELATALKAFFQLCESEPHAEGPHTEE